MADIQQIHCPFCEQGFGRSFTSLAEHARTCCSNPAVKEMQSYLERETELLGVPLDDGTPKKLPLVSLAARITQHQIDQAAELQRLRGELRDLRASQPLDAMHRYGHGLLVASARLLLLADELKDATDEPSRLLTVASSMARETLRGAVELADELTANGCSARHNVIQDP